MRTAIHTALLMAAFIVILYVGMKLGYGVEKP